MAGAAIVLDEVSVRYGAAGSTVGPLSFTVARGARTGLRGESGCGKTTLLRLLAGLLSSEAATSGTWRVSGRAGYIPQESTASLSPYLTAFRQVNDLTREPAETERLFSSVGLGGGRFVGRYPHQMSGGERQRILALQALAVKPDVILADEPAANLDEESERLMLAAIEHYASRSGAAILIASHRNRVFDSLGCTVFDMTPQPASGRVERPLRSATRNLVSAQNLVRRYPAVALDGASLTIGEGEAVALVGPSGAGKSTLAKLLAGWETPDAGKIEWEAQARRVQLVQQEPSESLNPRFTLGEALEEACGRADAGLLTPMQLPPDYLARRVSQLSEGQRARVAVARSAAALKGRGLLILDESFAGLDTATRTAVTAFLADRPAAVSLLVITHDVEVAEALGCRIVRIESGRTP